VEAAQILYPIDGISDRFTQHPAIPRRRDKNAWEYPSSPVCLGSDRTRLAGIGRPNLGRGAHQSRHNQAPHCEQQCRTFALLRRRHGYRQRCRHEDRCATIPDPEKGRAISI
jgi:hypothetical protein